MSELEPRSPASAPATSPDEEHARWPHAYALGAVLLLALVAYSTSFGGGFVFDDIRHVRDNARLRDLGALLTWDGYLAYRQRFVGYLSFAVNYALGRLDTTHYHVVNFAIHAANAALVYSLATLAFRTPRVRRSALARPATVQAIAASAAALFATHPLQTQAVTYVVQRFASLAALFYLSAVVLYLRWRLAREAGRAGARQNALYVGVLGAALLGMLTKEIALTVPLAIVLCEVTLFEPLPWRRRAFLAPIAATGLVVPLTLLSYVPLKASAIGGATRVQTGMSRLDYLLTESSVVLTYLRMLAWPVDQNVDHDYPIARGLLDPRVLASLACLAVIAGAVLVLYRRTSRGSLDPAARLLPLGVVWFFLALSVESSVVPIVDVIYEHRVYLPSAGLVVGAVAGIALLLHRISPRRVPTALVAIAAVVSVVLAVATLRRNRVWANDVTIWSDAAAKSPRKPRPHVNLGVALCLAGRVDEGARELRRGLELDPGPDTGYARAQLGAALVALGRTAEAEPELREALRLSPRDPEVLFNLAIVLATTGRAPEARPLFQRFLDVAPPAYAQARRIAERATR